MHKSAVEVMSDAPHVGTAALESWMRGNVPDFRGPIFVERLVGGQSNPTYKLSTASCVYALRRKPFGELLPGAHAVEREYRVMTALAGTDVPVPRTYALCEDPTVIGSAFYVMEFVVGRIHWDQLLPEYGASERYALFDSMNATVAALHRILPANVGLEDFGKPGNFMARQISRWTRQYQASVIEPIPEMDWLAGWLSERTPQQAPARLAHGDLRLDNLIFHPTEPRVLAVLDWELATLGDPIADFAYHTMVWRLPPDLFRGLAGIDHTRLGIPPEGEYVRAYCKRLGLPDIDNWEFYIVFSIFRLAAILQGVAKRAVGGNAANSNAVEVGAKARPVAIKGWELARRLPG